jgi:hypothetical protein
VSEKSSVKKKADGKQVLRLLAFGGLTALLYWLLFHNETRVLDVSSQGHWAFWIPVAIAFVFSFTHGTFTGEFWDALGIKAKKG